MLSYLQLKPNAVLPVLTNPGAFKCILIAREAVSEKWQALVSSWLVESDCLYAMAWGECASSWDDAIDVANLEAFEFKEVPEEKFVFTTWHDESVQEVMWYSQNIASHPKVNLNSTLLLEIGAANNEEELRKVYGAV